MRNRIIKLSLIILLTITNYAQNICEVQPGAKDSEIKLTVANVSEENSANNVKVILTQKSSALSFKKETETIEMIETKAEAEAKFTYDILISFIVKLKEQYKRAKTNEDNEVKTQNHPDVQWKISEYKKELQKNRSKEFWQDCPYKEKDI